MSRQGMASEIWRASPNKVACDRFRHRFRCLSSPPYYFPPSKCSHPHGRPRLLGPTTNPSKSGVNFGTLLHILRGNNTTTLLQKVLCAPNVYACICTMSPTPSEPPLPPSRRQPCPWAGRDTWGGGEDDVPHLVEDGEESSYEQGSS